MGFPSSGSRGEACTSSKLGVGGFLQNMAINKIPFFLTSTVGWKGKIKIQDHSVNLENLPQSKEEGISSLLSS